ncbi:MAG: hypothetical protein N4A71_10475 [Carboxylicivirga sp.]|jgi:hypothetical protein|nr:hypothetical protein [Carboxylicivirga sp.]
MIDKIKEFYQKNRLLIIIGLAMILLMQICSRGGRVDRTVSLPSETNQYNESVQDDRQLKPLDEIYYEEQQKEQRQNPEMFSLFILMGLVLFVFVATKRGWLQRLSPSIVWISVSIKRNKVTKERIASISIRNHTKESLTFSPPVLAFGMLFKKTRKFRIKGGSDAVFPLTLMPGTAHNISINLDVFTQKAGISSGSKWLKVEVNAGLKLYRSMWKYLF